MSANVNVSVVSEYCLSSVIYKSGSDNVNYNISSITKFLGAELDNVISDRPDIIIFPECCDRFCNMSDADQRRWYIDRKDKVLEFLQKKAKENNCYIVYPSIRVDDENGSLPFKNSIQIIGRDGKVCATYDKVHLVPHEYDERGTKYGNKPGIFDLDFGRVACAICFDLNFRDLLDACSLAKPKLVIFSSFFHGGLLQTQWAYNCRSYFAGAIFNAQSRIINPYGKEIASSTNYHGFASAEINLDYQIVHIDRNEEKVWDAKRKYGSSLTVFDPGYVGSVMLTYNDTDRTSLDIVKEFDMLLLDDYFRVCNEHREKHL